MTGGGLKRVLYLFLAGTFFVLAALGAFLPVLPTTPFLLLCSYFLTRSSPRLQRALERSRLFGPFLRDWKQHGGVRRPVKIWACVCVVTVVGLSLWRAELPVSARVGVVVLAAIGLFVVVRLKTIPSDAISVVEVEEPPAVSEEAAPEAVVSDAESA